MSRTAGRSRSQEPRPRRGRRGYHHGDLRRALLDAALGLIEREGLAALTLREAARQAGVSQAAPYRHFADKQALLAAVAAEGFHALTAEMAAASRAEGDDAVARFRALGFAYVGFATRHPSRFRVMFGREVANRAAHPALSEAARATFTLLAEAVTACQGAGYVREGSPVELAVSAWAMVHGVADLWLNRQLDAVDERPVEGIAHAVAADLFLGLGRRSG